MASCCGNKDKDKDGKLYCSAEETTTTTITKKFGSAACEMPRGAMRYVGERYITKFADPIEWDSTRSYEQIEAVQHEGFTYISKQPVPAGVQIDNEDFWLLWADPNAQMEQLRQFVEQTDAELREYVGETDTELREYMSTTVETLSGDLENLEAEVEAITDNYMVVIGDSFSNSAQSGTPLWYTIVSQRLQLTPVTYATDGQGYVIGQNNFGIQIDKCKDYFDSLENFDYKRVKKVYILGGLNDTRQATYTNADFFAAVQATLNKARNTFPYSEIEVYGPNSFPNVNKNSSTAAQYLSYSCAVRGIEYHDLTLTFNLFNSFFGGNGGSQGQNSMHPSAAGEKIIASTILNHGMMAGALYLPNSMIVDAQQPPYKLKVVDNHAVENDYTSEVVFQNFTKADNNYYKFECRIKPTNIPNTVTQLAVRLPYDAVNSMVKIGGIETSSNRRTSTTTPKISQLMGNTEHSGWIQERDNVTYDDSVKGAVIIFAINGSTGIDTGSGVASNKDIRIHCEWFT